MFSGIRLTGRNFILGTSSPTLNPLFKTLSEALTVALLPDPVTEMAWVRVDHNSTGQHLDALPGSLGLYDPITGAQILVADEADGRTLLSCTFEKDARLVLAKKVDQESPIAVAGQDITCKVDELVSFDASGSSDNLGISEYVWSLGDGLEARGERVAHRYSLPGTYQVVLRVVDVAGNTGEDSIMVTVQSDESGPSQWFDTRLLIAPLMFALLAVAYLYRARIRQL